MSLRLAMIVIVFWCVPSTVLGNVGETEAKAKQRTINYERKFLGFDPIYDIEDGKVAMECWQAPARMWSRDEALLFGKALANSTELPRLIRRDGANDVYELRNGIQIRILEGVPGRYISVEVTAKGRESSC